MKVLRFEEYYKSQSLAEEFIEILSNPLINENAEDKKAWRQILDKIFDDLGVNYALIMTFGTGIASMFPVVNELISNGNLNIELTKENVVLLTITALAITYLEEKKNKSTSFSVDINDDKIKEDAKTLLTELKLRGIGNGIVKKVVKAFTSIGNLTKLIFKNLKFIIAGFIDMFAYTSLLIPTMNAINGFIAKYDLNLDTIINNLISVGVGVLTIVAKNGIIYIINKIGSKFGINKEEVIEELPEPSIKKYPHPDFIDMEIKQKGDLIKGNEK